MNPTVEDFNSLAPYPANPENDGPADALARNYTVLAQANYIRMLEGPTPEIRHEATAVMLGLYSVVHLLRSLSVNPAPSDTEAPADVAARALLYDLGSPHVFGPTIWSWLIEYGIDPEKIDSMVASMEDMKPDAKDKA